MKLDPFPQPHVDFLSTFVFSFNILIYNQCIINASFKANTSVSVPQIKEYKMARAFQKLSLSPP